jgi:hypothetical protein
LNQLNLFGLYYRLGLYYLFGRFDRLCLLHQLNQLNLFDL